MESVYNRILSVISEAKKDEERFNEYAKSSKSGIINLKAICRIVHIGQIEIPEIIYYLFYKLDLFQNGDVLLFGFQFHTFEAFEKLLRESKEQIIERMTIEDLKITHKVVSDIIFIANEWSELVRAATGVAGGEK